MTKTISISPAFDTYLWFVKTKDKTLGASQIIEKGIILASQILLEDKTKEFSEWCRQNGKEEYLQEFLEQNKAILKLLEETPAP